MATRRYRAEDYPTTYPGYQTGLLYPTESAQAALGFGRRGFSDALMGQLGNVGGGGFGLGGGLPQLTSSTGFGDALKSFIGDPGGGSLPRPPGPGVEPTTAPQAGGGMSGLEKAALISTLVGGLGNLYGAYQEGRARDREYDLVRKRERRRRELADRLEPYLEQLLASRPERGGGG